MPGACVAGVTKLAAMDTPAESRPLRLIINPQKRPSRARALTEAILLALSCRMPRAQCVMQVCTIIRTSTEAECSLMSLAGHGRNTRARTTLTAPDSDRPQRRHV